MTDKTKCVGVRVAVDTADYFKGKPLNRYVESLQDLMERGKIKADEGELIVIGGLPEEEETAELGSYFDMSLKDMISEFNRLLNDGDISCENKKLYSVLPNWVQDIGDACHDTNIPVEKAAERMIDMIQRGQV